MFSIVQNIEDSSRIYVWLREFKKMVLSVHILFSEHVLTLGSDHVLLQRSLVRQDEYEILAPVSAL